MKIHSAMSIKPISELSDQEWEELKILRDAVYPPETESGWSGANMEWASPQWRVRVWAPDGKLACTVGILFRTGTYNDTRTKIAGIGSVSTHPLYRGRGYAENAMRFADKFFHTCDDIDFGLLVCDTPLLDYYAKFGWKEFRGKLTVTQFGERTEFTYSPIMTLPIRCQTPTSGQIDLGGPPW